MPQPTWVATIAMNPWLSAVSAVTSSPQYIADLKDNIPTAAGCLITDGSGSLQITFANNIKTTTCWFQKKANTRQPAFVSFGTSFPHIAYYVPLLQVALHNLCAQPDKPTCAAKIVVPHSVGAMALETAATLSNITCTTNNVAVTAFPATVSRTVSQSPTRIMVNQYDVVVDSRAPQGNSTTCSFIINKHPALTSFFQVALDADTVIYTVPPTTLRGNNLAVNHLSDCEDPTSTICTMTYLSPLAQNLDVFRVDMPFFTTPYDPSPVEDETYVAPQETYYKLYKQRFLKSITPQGGVSDVPTAMTTLHLTGTMLPMEYQYNVTTFKADVPLEVVVDTAVCQDPNMPICRVRYRSRYVGRRIALKLLEVPFYGAVDAVNCHGPMFISNADIVMAPLDTAAEHANTIISPPSDAVGGYTECVVDYAIPFGGSSNEPPVTQIVVNAVREYSSHFEVIRYAEKAYPLGDPADWVFHELPFSVSYDPKTCATLSVPLCTFNITISPTHTFFAAVTTTAEKDDILRRTFIRQLSMALHQLRTPNTKYGEKDFVHITLYNSGMMQISWNVLYVDASLGFHSLQLEFYNDQLDRNDITFDNFFKDDPHNVGKKLDVVVSITYDLYVLSQVETPMKIVNYTLLSYNGVAAQQGNWPTMGSGPVGYSPLYTFSADVDACGHENSAICYFRFRSLMDNEAFKDITLTSINVEIPTAQFVDIQYPMSSTDFITAVEPLNNRTDENGRLTPRLFYKLHLAPMFKGDQVILAVVKRIGAQGLAKVEFPRYDALLTTARDENGVPTASVPFHRLLNFYYVITEINYVGDLKFTYDADCYDRSDVHCTYHLSIVTNNLLPGTTLMVLPQSGKDQSFYWVEPKGCEGWVNVTRAASFDLFKMDYDIASGATTFRTPWENPLTLSYDPTVRTGAVCTFSSYKMRQPPQYHAPVTPWVMMNVSFFEPPYNLYPYPERHSTKIMVDRRLEYNHFSSEFLEDCTTSYVDALRCTTRYTSHGTPLNPMVNATGEIPMDLLAKNPSFALMFMFGTMLYQEWCTRNMSLPLNNTPWDPNWPQIDPGVPLGFNLDKDLKVWTLSPFYTQRGNTSSPVFATCYSAYHLCDMTKPYQTVIEVAPEYQNTTADGYFYLELASTFFPQDRSQVVIDALPYQMLYNLNPANAELAAILRRSPDRVEMSPMVMGRLMDVEIATRRVNEVTISPIIYTLYTAAITHVEIESTLGLFTNNATWLPCHEYDTNSTAHLNPTTQVVVAWLKTDPTTMLSFLEVAHPTEYTPGVKCQVLLPITRGFPTQTQNILHTTYTKDYAASFKSHLSYPSYHNDAVVNVVGAGAWADNGAAITSAAGVTRVVVLVVLVVVGMVMF